MTEAQWQYMETYIRDLADRMRLRDWTLVLKRTPPDTADAGAAISVIYGRKRAEIQLCEDFDSQKPDDQRHFIVHELIHCHIDQTDTMMRQLEPVVGKAAFAIVESNHHCAVENATDALADVLAPFMPACEIPAED